MSQQEEKTDTDYNLLYKIEIYYDKDEKLLSIKFSNKKTKQKYSSEFNEDDILLITEGYFKIDVFFAILQDSLLKKPKDFITVCVIPQKINKKKLTENSKFTDDKTIDIEIRENDEGNEKISVLTILINYKEHYAARKFEVHLVEQDVSPVEILELKLDDTNEDVANLRPRITTLNKQIKNLKKQLESGKKFTNMTSNPNKVAQTTGSWISLTSMELPQQAGKYVVQYSTEATHGGGQNGLINFKVTLGGVNGAIIACKNSGFYTHVSNTAHGIPYSGFGEVTLKGNENKEQRTIHAVGFGDGTHKNTYTNTILYAKQL